MKTVKELIARIEKENPRSAWQKGVKEYALELLKGIAEQDKKLSLNNLTDTLLGSMQSWTEYSWAGCSLLYDADIAKRLCNPTELKLTHNGERQPNSNEHWYDLQAKALHEAERLIRNKIGISLCG
jgi:hypothetical protein